MKGFGKIALLFGLLGGLMAYFIVPLHFSRKRSCNANVLHVDCEYDVRRFFLKTQPRHGGAFLCPRLPSCYKRKKPRRRAGAQGKAADAGYRGIAVRAR
jgi:hypothetical protein